MKAEDEITRYRELLRRDPRSRVFGPLAEAIRRTGNLDEALALARDGVAHHPSYAGGRLALGRVLLDLGRVREAAEHFDGAIAAAPGGASAWRLLGAARTRLRDRSGAFEAFARALALDPLDEEARRAVLDIDSLIASAAPPVEPEPEDLEEKTPGRTDEMLTGLEEAWIRDEELSLLLIPLEAEIEPPAFLAGRLDVLDTVHSSLAPEAAGPSEIPEAARSGIGALEMLDDGSRTGEGEEIGPGPEPSWEFLDEDPAPEMQIPEAIEPADLPPDLRTETLADLCVAQGHPERARDIYRAILVRDPLHLRVKKKLLELPSPAPTAAEGAADSRIASLNRWLDLARGPGAGARTARKDRMKNPARIVTTPPSEEGR